MTTARRDKRALLKPLVLVCVLTALLLSASPAQASDSDVATFFAVDSEGGIWTVDMSSVSSTFVGPTGFPVVGDLAFSPSGELFGTTTAELIAIDPLTGVGTLIGSHGPIPGIVVGLDFTADGTLYATTRLASDGGALLTIDPTTGTSGVAQVMIWYGSATSQVLQCTQFSWWITRDRPLGADGSSIIS